MRAARPGSWIGALALTVAVACRPAVAADPAKVLRVAFGAAETGFDPQAAGDLYSQYVTRALFDALYRYDWLERPRRIVPNTAAALPEISADGKVWLVRIRPGIYFSDDPAFAGRKRELTAADYVYSWKRVIDPRVRSSSLQVFDGKFAGAESLVAAARASGRFDYDAPLPGLRAVDRYTLRLELNDASYDLLADLTTTPTAAVAREVVEAYGDSSGWVMAQPVGTGPFRLKTWQRGRRIVLEASPTFRDEVMPQAAGTAGTAADGLRGRKLPLVGGVEISIIDESNPRLLAFLNHELDYVAVPPDLAANVLAPDDTLLPSLAARGIRLGRGVQPSIVYTYFNMQDPVVGGYGKDRIALRRAIGMAYNSEEEIRVMRQGQAAVATQPIPPNVTGHDPFFDAHVKQDVAGARALLDRFGYIDRDGDGWRDLPDGKPLVLAMGSDPSALNRQSDELWQRSMSVVGVRTEFVKQKWPDLLKMARHGQLRMWTLANTSTTAEGFGFMGLLYGPHAGLSNLSRFDLADFNRLYEEARPMPDGPARTQILRRMSELVSAYAPWQLNAYRIENVLVHPWVLGYQHDVFHPHPWMYYDIDLKRRKAARS